MYIRASNPRAISAQAAFLSISPHAAPLSTCAWVARHPTSMQSSQMGHQLLYSSSTCITASYSDDLAHRSRLFLDVCRFALLFPLQVPAALCAISHSLGPCISSMHAESSSTEDRVDGRVVKCQVTRCILFSIRRPAIRHSCSSMQGTLSLR